MHKPLWRIACDKRFFKFQKFVSGHLDHALWRIGFVTWDCLSIEKEMGVGVTSGAVDHGGVDTGHGYGFSLLYTNRVTAVRAECYTCRRWILVSYVSIPPAFNWVRYFVQKLRAFQWSKEFFSSFKTLPALRPRGILFTWISRSRDLFSPNSWLFTM